MEDDVLTIMFVRQSGKIRSIKLEIKKLFFLAAGLVSLILAFVGLMYGYIYIYRENSNLLAMVEKIEKAEIAIPSEEVSKQRISEEGAGDEVVKLQGIDEEAEGKIVEGIQKEVVENLDGKLINIFSTDSDSYKIAVEDFEVEKSDKIPGIKVIFKIINVNQVSKIMGFWAIVGENNKKNVIFKRSYPKDFLNSKGEIVNNKNANLVSATWFSIERLKPVTGQLEFDNEFDDYNAIYIYIYSTKGDLLLQSKFNRWRLTT